MKRTIKAAWVVAFCGVAGGAMAQDAACPPEKYGCGKAQAMAARFLDGLRGDEDGPWGATREALTDTDLISVDLDIEITPSGASTGLIAGNNTMRVRSLVNGLTQFTFRLRSNYTISSMVINGITPLGAAASVGTYGRIVTLDRAYNAGEEFTLRVNYSGVAVNVGLGSIYFTTQGGQPVVSSLSEPYYGASWWPCKDGDYAQPGDNADKAVGSIAITAPTGLITVSNGLLTSTTNPSAGKTRYRWTTNSPTAPYLFFFGTTNYNQWSQTYTYPLAGGGTGSMPVQFSIYPGSDTPANRAAWELCLPMMSTLRPIYGEYPFVGEKYGMYQFPFGGGMEHQTCTGMGGFWEDVVVHELGHQWWGDDVTCKYWNDIWLNEGFATYTEALWAERKPGSTGLPALRSAMNARRPSAVNDSVYCSSVTSVNRIFSSNFSYLKGGWVLHQLRRKIGDTAFFATLAQYRATYSGSGATTNNFRDVAASVSGMDLTGWFADWVFGIGAPAYTYAYQNATLNGQPYVKLLLTQTQDVTWGTGQKFQTPLDVRVTEGAGTQNFVVQQTARSQHFLLPVSAAATALAIDPDDWVLITSKTAGTYTSGPAKVISASPAIGAALSSAPASIVIGLSEPVNALASRFTLTGPGGGVPFTFTYNAGTLQATLTPTAPLGAGTYTVGVLDTLTTVTGSYALDGEVVGGALPSGDGTAGGSASWTFGVAPSCPADIDAGSGTGTPDGGVDINDLLYFLDQYEGGLLAADLDDGSGTGTPDGGVDINDLLFYLGHYEGGC